jgi:serine/threonine protein kinase
MLFKPNVSNNRQTMASTNTSIAEFRRDFQKGSAPRPMTLADKYFLMLGATRGVAFLHSKGFMHCDIKSPNFLMAKVLMVT